MQNHPTEKNDIIVKYYRLGNSIEAYESLIDKYDVNFVPTKHNSDEINDFYANDANITHRRNIKFSIFLNFGGTLNMFKIKSPTQMGKRIGNSSEQMIRMQSAGLENHVSMEQRFSNEMRSANSYTNQLL